MTREGTLTGRLFLSLDLYPTFLNTGTTDKTFQQSGKQDFFRHIVKSLASIYESSGSQFFKTTTGIQAEPDAFGESRLALTFSTILQNYCEVSDQFFKGKQVKKYLSHQDQSSEKSFQQTILLYQMQRQHLRAVKERRYSRFTFLRTLAIHQKFQAPSFSKMMDSCFISICRRYSFSYSFD